MLKAQKHVALVQIYSRIKDKRIEADTALYLSKIETDHEKKIMLESKIADIELDIMVSKEGYSKLSKELLTHAKSI